VRSDATEICKYLIQWQVAAEYPERDQELMELTLKNKRKNRIGMRLI
jgi:hypothetical protein